MDQIYPDVGLPNILAKVSAPTTTWHLYDNNVTPTRATILTDLNESSFVGYAAVTCLDIEWVPQPVVGGLGLLLHPPIGFTNNSGGPVDAYGFYSLDDSGNLLSVARFDSAPMTKADGETFVLLPTLGDFSESP